MLRPDRRGRSPAPRPAASFAPTSSPEDVPALICGLGRAVRSEVERPTMSWQRYLEIILAGLRA